MPEAANPGIEVAAGESLGLYLSFPFCRTKCSFCNFASAVHSPSWFGEYVQLLRREAELAAAALGGRPPVDTIYWGGGTPSLLPPAGWGALAGTLARCFDLSPGIEHTVEVAPGTLSDALLEAFQAAGVNRVSLGVQSFVDAEARAVGRLHTAAIVASDLARLRAAGFTNLNLDLIAGLPLQTPASWAQSLDAVLTAAVPHVSVYMLEVDDESRLGSELLAGGSRYQAATVPDEDRIADWYLLAGERLEAAGLPGYEISNFARPGFESRHNDRYWLRRPYLGLGVDAHSLLPASGSRWGARCANPDQLEAWAQPLRAHRLPRSAPEPLTRLAAGEESLFLGLRRSAGVALPEAWAEVAARLEGEGWLERVGARIRLTPRGRLFSNQVLAEFLGEPARVP